MGVITPHPRYYHKLRARQDAVSDHLCDNCDNCDNLPERMRAACTHCPEGITGITGITGVEPPLGGYPPARSKPRANRVVTRVLGSRFRCRLNRGTWSSALVKHPSGVIPCPARPRHWGITRPSQALRSRYVKPGPLFHGPGPPVSRVRLGMFHGEPWPASGPRRQFGPRTG
jgi:hypothetical protein